MLKRDAGRAAAPVLLTGFIALGIALATAVGTPLPADAQSTLSSDQVEGIESVFADIATSAPGCAVGVVADRELAYARGFGIANLDYDLPITPRSNFYLGSVGKQFTAAAIAHAERAGKLSLDDPIQKWVPEIPEYDRPITVRHLVHHTSGIRDYLGLWSLSGRQLENVYTDDEVLAMIARQLAPNFPAGEEYLYSNSGYFLLSVIVERATGMSLREYAEAELLRPLGMTRTRVHDDRLDVIPDRVVGYDIADGEWHIEHPWNFDQVGSGGVYSSIEDLVHWDRNYYTEEVGGPGFTQRLRERGTLADGSTIPYAFGLTHGEYRGLATIGHGGSLAGFRSNLLRFPEERTTVLVLCNFPTSNPASRARQVADVVLADRLEKVEEPAEVATEDAAEDASANAPADETPASDPAAAALTPEQLDAFTGHWRTSTGVEIEIRREEDRLLFVQGATRAPLTILSDSTLRLDRAAADMTFSDPEEGKYTSQAVVQRGQPFTAERFDPATEARDYSAVVGEYHSDELDVTYRLYESDGDLMLAIPPSRTARVYLVVEGDRVRTPVGTLELERRDGRVVGFTIDAGRVRGIRFERR